MYHPEVVGRRLYDLARADRENTKLDPRERFDPVDRTLAECDEMAEHLIGLINPDTARPRRPLRTDERKWVRHERLRCTADYRYWLEKYARINNYEGRLSNFELNVAQEMIMAEWGDMERQDLAVMMLQLKARQLGASTITELAVQHRAQFYTDVNAVVASASPDQSAKMSHMMALCRNEQPWFLLPAVTAKNQRMIEFGGLNSAISIQHGTQFNGISRGSTPHVVHLCVSPNTLIQVADGLLKPMREVQSGDRVITHTGAASKVKTVWTSPRRNEMTSELWMWGEFAPTVTTRDHRILTREGWKEARHIHSNDWIVRPVRMILNNEKKIAIDTLRLGRPRTVRGERLVAKRRYTLNRDWGYFIGLYLAEGSCQWNRGRHLPGARVTGMVLTVDAEEISNVKSAVHRALGNDHYGIRHASKSRTTHLYIADAATARWVNTHFGEKDRKRIPDWVWEGSREFALGLVHGYLDGDGHWSKGANEIVATSVRVQLSVHVRELVASLGCGWSSIYYKEPGVYFDRNCRAAWTLAFSGPTGQRLRELCGKPSFASEPAYHWRWHEGRSGPMIEVKVDRNLDGFSSEFFDLEVEGDDHSFCALQAVLHNSEICDFDHAEELIEASLLRAIHETPWTFVILESTAKGFFGYWPTKWKEVKAGWPKRQSRFCPIFLPWFVGYDIYPTEAWLRKQPIPGDWIPSDMVIAHAERAAMYVSVNPLLTKFLGSGWRMPREQMWFYESEYAAAKAKRAVNQFLSEMPADENEAWQSMDETAFDGEIIQFYRNDTGRRRPFGVFKFRGRQDDIPLVIQPHAAEIDTSRRPVELTCQWGSASDKLMVELVPVKYEGPGDDPDGKVFIYEPPKSQFDYGYGCDTAYGVGEDSSVLEMIRKATPLSAPAQVAEFASAWVGALSLWPVAMALGTLYSPNRKQCRATIECRGIGDTVQHELRKRGWSNFHPWTHIDSRVINLTTPQKLGWFTNEAMREVLMDWVLSAVNDRWLDLSSPYFVLEMSSLSKKQRQSYRAEAGAHDDRILSMGMILVSLHQHEKHGLKPGRIAHSAWRPSTPEPEIVDDPVFDPGWQGRDTRDTSQIKGYLRSMGAYYRGVAKGESRVIKRGLGNTSYRAGRRAR